jgi:putative Mg2+ transporter-C (MgtC) family protein
MQELFGTDKFDILPHVVAMLAAYLLAIPLGWNREREERSAGLRTFPLVAIAACGFIQAAEVVAAGSAEALARINEGVIVGMGFIGGGAILRLKDSVQGTATAASIWVTGAIGVSCGLGAFDIAVVLAVVAFATLWIMRPLKKVAGVEDDDVGNVRTDP